MTDYQKIKSLKSAELALEKKCKEVEQVASKRLTEAKVNLRKTVASLTKSTATKNKKEARIAELHKENTASSRKAVAVMERNFKKFLADYKEKQAAILVAEQWMAMEERKLKAVQKQNKIEQMAFQLNWVQFGGKAKAQEIYIQEARKLSREKMDMVKPVKSDSRSPWVAKKVYSGSVK